MSCHARRVNFRFPVAPSRCRRAKGKELKKQKPLRNRSRLFAPVRISRPSRVPGSQSMFDLAVESFYSKNRLGRAS